jgi:hypothetical protein
MDASSSADATSDASEGGGADGGGGGCNLSMISVLENGQNVSLGTPTCSNSSTSTATVLNFFEGLPQSPGSLELVLFFNPPLTSSSSGTLKANLTVTETTADGGTLTYAPPGMCSVMLGIPPQGILVNGSTVYVVNATATCPAPTSTSAPLAVGGSTFNFEAVTPL